MSESTNELINNVKLKYQTMYGYMHKIQVLKEEISGLKKILYTTCEHDWIRDWDEPSDSICKWKCKHCDLSRNPYCN